MYKNSSKLLCSDDIINIFPIQQYIVLWYTLSKFVFSVAKSLTSYRYTASEPMLKCHIFHHLVLWSTVQVTDILENYNTQNSFPVLWYYRLKLKCKLGITQRQGHCSHILRKNTLFGAFELELDEGDVSFFTPPTS